MKIKVPSDLLVGQYLQFIALHVAVAIAATYALGYTCGQVIHKTNDILTNAINDGIPSSLHKWQGRISLRIRDRSFLHGSVV